MRKIILFLSVLLLAATASVAFAENCEALLVKQESEFKAINARSLPENSNMVASASLGRVLWMTNERIKLLEAHCPSSGEFPKMIEGLRNAHNHAKTQCVQLHLDCPPPEYLGTTVVATQTQTAELIDDPQVLGASASPNAGKAKVKGKKKK